MKYKDQKQGKILIELCLSILLIELSIKITSWAIVSLAGGGLGKVEKEEHQGETEVNRLLSHLQGTILG